MTKDVRAQLRAICDAAKQSRDYKNIARSLRWLLNNIEDEGPNTFTHAIHGYVGEAVRVLENEDKTALPTALDALDEADIDRNCAHAGECAGCKIKQSDCFSYHVFLVKKYETLALKNACASDEAIADRDHWKARAEAWERWYDELTKQISCYNSSMDKLITIISNSKPTASLPPHD